MIAKISRPFKALAAFLTILLICGCATFPRASRGGLPGAERGEGAPAKMDSQRIPAERYRSLALRYEKDQQLYTAVFLWRVVRKFDRGDRQADEKIRELDLRIRSAAEEHFLNGVEYARRSAFDSARNEFLMTLAYDPNQPGALEFLRNAANFSGYTRYETKRGDTIRTVAQKVYGDPEKDFIIAHFGNMNSNDSLRPGTVLKLPLLEEKAESKARRMAQPNMPQSSVSKQSASRTSVSKPSSLRVPRDYDKAGAESHYRMGVSFFLAEDMQRAIREWEQALSLDPEHPNARRNIEKARNLLKKGQLK